MLPDGKGLLFLSPPPVMRSYNKEQSESSLTYKNKVFLPFVNKPFSSKSISALRFTSQWPLTSLHQMVSV